MDARFRKTLFLHACLYEFMSNPVLHIQYRWVIKFFIIFYINITQAADFILRVILDYCQLKWKVAVSTATPNIEISSLNFDPDILSRQTQGKGTSTLKGTRNY